MMLAGMLAAMAVMANATADVGKLDWLAGTWVSEVDGVVVREMWLAPRDGAMAGATQTTSASCPSLMCSAAPSAEKRSVSAGLPVTPSKVSGATNF